MQTFNGSCDTCARPMFKSEYTTGYGVDELANRHCYQCCAEHDLAYMRDRGKISMYLVHRPGSFPDTHTWVVKNWPDSVEFKPFCVRRSDAAAYGRRIPRYDAWFNFEGFVWHCVNKGDMQLARCRRTKQVAQ